jgi:hypothetical protein
MPTNPYATPTAELGSESQSPPLTVEPGLLTIARATFLAWERLRIVYVVLLGALCVLLAGPHLLHFKTPVMLAECAILANLCFFAGPLMETYARWLGYSGRWVRWALFINGTLLTAVLATMTLASQFLPNQP